ncbi:uncharacterized protein LOC141611379 [Silene latifolia]|uniref:uncharacterized protein LOC141611379 n=1 Tax=Silene latifolia TaxID=37657 RepID=UPI003D76C257
MGSKKRGTSSIDDNVVAVKRDEFVEKIDSKKKKLNQEEKTDDGEKGEIPMETKKKRKMLDKERRRVESQANELKPVKSVVNSVANVEGDAEEMETDMGVRDDQPVFHIDVFGDLASGNDGKREAAAERLAVELKEVQKAFEKVGNTGLNNGGSKLEAEKDDGLDNCAESVRYAVRRLVRGVSSSRECARQGFALGLTILLGTNMTVRLDSVIKLVDDLLEVTSSMKGQEARDVLLGRLFAYGAVVRSRRLKEQWDCNSNTPLIKEVTRLLISLASKKRYLQEPAVAVLWDLIEMLPKEAVLKHILDIPGVREWFNGATDSGNPDALLLALRVREKIATDSEIFGPLLPRPFSSSRFFTVEHLNSIAKCLKESTFCQPRVHGIWPLLVNMLLPDTVLQDANCSSSKKHKKSRRASSSDEDSEAKLKIFNEVVLEDSLLTGSHDRKHLVFDILLLMLPRLPASYLPIVLSLKFVQCLMDVLSTKDSWLHKVAINFLMKVSDWVESDDIRRTFVIVALQKHSGGRFDSITRTKTVKDLMTAFTTESGCMLFIQKLSSIFIDEEPIVDEPSDENQPMDEESEMVTVQAHGSAESSSRSDILKSWVVESLPGLLKYLTLDLEAKAKVQKEVMKFLAVQGLFSATLGTEVTSFELEETFRWPKTPISSALSRKCVDQLQVLLSNAQKAEGSHALTNGLETNDLGCYFMRFLGTFCTIPSVSFVRPLSNDDEIAFKTVLDMESRLSREGRNCGLSAEANKVHALRYLLIQLLLQLLLRPGEIAEAASELVICCRKAFPVNDDAESSGEEESHDGESPALMDVLVDTLLSLLPQSSAPLRSAVEQVFRYFCEDITDDGLMRMLRVVKKDLKPPRRINIAKVKENEENEEEVEEEEEDEDDDDDDDLLALEEAEESNEAGDNSGATAHADASDEEVSDADEDDDNDDDSDNDDDDDMDDEAMFRFDALVSKIFQERKNKTGGNSAHAQLLVFKFRVLSLVEIYLHENPGSTRVLTVYAKLVQAFVRPSATEGSEQLAQRILGVLQKKVFKAKDYPKGDDVQLSTLETLLGKSLRLVARRFYKKKAPQKKKTVSQNRFKTINSLAQQSTHWILKVIDGRKFPEAELGRVFDIFKVAIKKYFKKKSSLLKPEFLKEVIKRRPWIGQHLFGFLLKECGDAKYGYRRVEALDLVQELFKSVLVQSTPDGPKKILKPHLSELSHLVHQLAVHMPEKQARRAEVRKFLGKALQIVSTNNLAKSFLKTLDPDAHAICESQFGETFLALKKTEK